MTPPTGDLMALHSAALNDWLYTGCPKNLALCDRYIKQGVPCASMFVVTDAAMKLITTKWAPEWAGQTGALLKRYVGSGLIPLDQRMQVSHAGTVHWDAHGLPLLVVAANYRNVDAVCVLLELGALEVTDLTIDGSDHAGGRVPVTGAARLAAFDEFARKHWPGLPHVQARFSEALMRRHIQLVARGEPSDIDAAAPAVALHRRRVRAV